MNEKYIVSNDEYLAKRGLDLNEVALDGTLIPAIIWLGYDLLVSRICYLDDSKKSEEDIVADLDKHPEKVWTFYKAQYRIIYNLVYQNETSPVDPFVDTIIVHELGWGKINGWQKGVYFKQNA